MTLVRDAVERGRRLAVSGGRALLLAAARRRRRGRRGATFVAVTGSAGKTTTCRLLVAALAPAGRSVLSLGELRQTVQLARAVRAVTRRHRFCVLELAAFEPGSLDGRLRAYEPDVGVVTTIGDDHLSRFGTRTEIAAEKRKLVEALAPSGIAVLNADDDAVKAMAEHTAARVVLFGRSPEADFRAEDVSPRPGGLVFTLVTADARVAVRTRLRGEVWLPAVLAALATAASLGVDVEAAAAALATVEPSDSRLSFLETESGVTFIRDDWKASAWTVRPALETLATLADRRRIAVLGSVSDDRRRPRMLYAALAREARRHAELVVLVGPWAHHGLRAREHERDESIVAFDSTPKAIRFLRGYLAPGDVVLVKATHGRTHVERVSVMNTVDLACMRESCVKPIVCDFCELLTPTGKRRPQATSPARELPGDR